MMLRKMLQGRRTPRTVYRIEHGYDEAGRSMMRFMRDQVSARETLGAYLPSDSVVFPEVPPLPGIVSDGEESRGMADGWFRPTKEFERQLINYELGNQYRKETGEESRNMRRFLSAKADPKFNYDTYVKKYGEPVDTDDLETNITGSVNTPDKGRMSMTLASFESDGTYFDLVMPDRLPSVLPGKDPVAALCAQEAGTHLADMGQRDPRQYAVFGQCFNEMRDRYERSLQDAGGKQAVIRECNMRMLMHNHKAYEKYGSTEEIREEGKRLLADNEARYAEEMRGARTEPIPVGGRKGRRLPDLSGIQGMQDSDEFSL